MRKFVSEHRTSLAIGVLVFILIASILSVGIMAGQDKRDKEDYEKIINVYVPDGVLVYGADDSAPPLRFVDEDGAYKGVVIDYMSQLSLELGIEISTVPYKWSEALQALKEGETDLCDMFVNEERAKYFVFTEPIYTLRTIMAAMATKDYQQSDIQHMRVATQEGDYANWYIETFYQIGRAHV